MATNSTDNSLLSCSAAGYVHKPQARITENASECGNIVHPLRESGMWNVKCVPVDSDQTSVLQNRELHLDQVDLPELLTASVLPGSSNTINLQ